MKKVLIVVHDMKIGGVQKSLLSFLQCFAKSEYLDSYELHLLIQEPKGELLIRIPMCVKVIPPSKPLRWLGTAMSSSQLMRYFSWRGLLGKLIWVAGKNLGLLRKELNIPQKLWNIWRWLIPSQKDAYDIAISFQDGCSNYFVIDKVTADRKVLWVHSEYQKQGYFAPFDKSYFTSADAILTISEDCRQCLVREFQSLEEKIHVLENITIPDDVLRKGDESVDDGFDDDQRFHILSVGRLNKQKGFDIAVAAAAYLRTAGKRFKWLVVGEGSEHTSLQEKIDELGLADSFVLLGSKENPYPYMKNCDILVQPSRVEGKSIVLDEAKVFYKPVVATNYATVAASITHGKDGWIVGMNPEALCEGIIYMMENPQVCEKFRTYLKKQAQGNTAEFNKYIQLMLR